MVQELACKRSGEQAKQYKQLLHALNDVAHHEIDEWMRHERQLSEPFVARTVSQQLPSGIVSICCYQNCFPFAFFPCMRSLPTGRRIS